MCSCTDPRTRFANVGLPKPELYPQPPRYPAFHLSGAAYKQQPRVCANQWLETPYVLPAKPACRPEMNPRRNLVEGALRRKGWGPMTKSQLLDAEADIQKFDKDKTIGNCSKKRSPSKQVRQGFLAGDHVLLDVAQLKLTASQARIFDIERRKWGKILALYSHLDVKGKGYIDLKDSSLALKRLARNYEQNAENEPSSMPLHVMLLCVLEELSSYVSSRGVVERDVFLLCLKGWLDNYRFQNKKEVPEWLITLASDQVGINPVLQKADNDEHADFRIHDSAQDAFYSGPQQLAPVNRPPPPPNGTDRRLQDHVGRIKKATQRCVARGVPVGDSIGIRREPVIPENCPEGVVLHVSDRPNERRHVDEALRFRMPFFDQCHPQCKARQAPLSQKSAPAQPKWNVDVTRLANAFPGAAEPRKADRVLLLPVTTSEPSGMSVASPQLHSLSSRMDAVIPRAHLRE